VGEMNAKTNSALRYSILNMDAQQFREAGDSLADRIAQLLESIADQPVNPAESPVAVRGALNSDES
jgi:hypothetical protein